MTMMTTATAKTRRQTMTNDDPWAWDVHSLVEEMGFIYFLLGKDVLQLNAFRDHFFAEREMWHCV